MKKNIVIFLLKIIELLVGVSAVFVFIQRYIDNILLKDLKEIDKFKSYYLMHETWVKLYQKNIKLDDYFEKQHIKKIAIYGYGKLGSTFYREMKDSKIKVSYIIDRNAMCFIEDVPVLNLRDDLPKVDAIVVTIPEQIFKIKKDLEEICNYPVLSLETVIYGSSQDE